MSEYIASKIVTVQYETLIKYVITHPRPINRVCCNVVPFITDWEGMFQAKCSEMQNKCPKSCFLSMFCDFLSAYITVGGSALSTFKKANFITISVR